MIVQLEPGVWLADGDGDPPRTLRKENAKEFNGTPDAAKALAEARRYQPFENARFYCGRAWFPAAEAAKDGAE